MIVYVHIPKCGGTTITHAMRLTLGVQKVLRAGTAAQTAALCSAPKSAFRGVKGVAAHLPHSTLREIFGSRARYCATVREPLARTLSMFQHIHSLPKHPQHSFAKSLSEWLDFLAANPRARRNASQSHSLDSDRPIVLGDTSDLEAFSREAFGASPDAIVRQNVSKVRVNPTPAETTAIRHLFADDFHLYAEYLGRRPQTHCHQALRTPWPAQAGR